VLSRRLPGDDYFDLQRQFELSRTLDAVPFVVLTAGRRDFGRKFSLLQLFPNPVELTVAFG
jgi:hypothetical protein